MAKAKSQTAAVAAITLAQIVEATLDNERGFLYVPESVYAPLVEQGLVEVNADMKNDAGDYAVRATEKGQSTVTNETQPQAAAATAAVTSNFTLDSDIAMPTVKQRIVGGETYPFDKMEVGNSFFVPATAERPNPAKSMASTVSSATARYAKPAEDGATRISKRTGKEMPVMVETRKFVVRSVDETEQGRGKGARVWRTA